MKINESTLPEMFSKALFEEKNLDLAAEHMDKIMDIIFTGTANLLSNVKSMNKPVAFTFTKLDQSFIAAAMVQFFKNEDESKPGNWSLSWTFDPADIPVDATKIDISDAQSHSYFRAVAGEKYGIRFEMQSDILDCITMALTQLKKWLDENAKEGVDVKIEQDGIFQARVAVENGEKVFAVEADGEVKNLIKDDTADEK